MAMLNMAYSKGKVISARALFRRSIRGITHVLPVEPVLFRQSLGVLFICAMIDLLPGYFLGAMERYLVLVPGLLMILPPTVGLRGNTFGALASRVSSKLHLGVIEPRLLGNRPLKDQIVATGIQLIVLSALIPFIGALMGIIFHVEIAPMSVLVFISVTSGILSGILMFIISLGIILITFRRGWDPDNVSAPIIASSGDILTIPILFLSAWLTLHIRDDIVTVGSIIALILIAMTSSFALARYRKEVRAILIGMFPIAFSAITISTIAGLLLGASFDAYLQGSVFLLLIPAFNGQGGSLGSILGSRLSSADYLGEDRVTIFPNHTGRSSMFTLWIISLVVFLLMGLGALGLGLVVGINTPPFLRFVLIMLAGATGVTVISSLIAYYVTFISLKAGLDPDNVVIPLLTSTMDVVGSGTLILTLLLLGGI